MTDLVPPGAFPDAAKVEQTIATKVLGGPRTAFDKRSTALVAMRNGVNDHEKRLDVVEQCLEALQSRPF